MGLGERLVEKVMNLVVVRNTHDLFKRRVQSAYCVSHSPRVWAGGSLALKTEGQITGFACS
jgi:hypothetical protein